MENRETNYKELYKIMLEGSKGAKDMLMEGRIDLALLALVWAQTQCDSIIEHDDEAEINDDELEDIGITGLDDQLIKEGLTEFRPQGRNKIQSIFCRDMRVAKNTSQPANVQIVFHRKTMRALQQAASPSC